MFKIIGLVLVGLIVILLVVAATKPDTFHVARTTNIDAPANAIFPLITDFRQWPAWSPWEGLDPEMTRVHDGPERGVGASYAWSGNRKAGEGRMEITEVEEPSHLAIRLDFIRPFASSNVVEFQLDEHGESTEVTWSMHGPNTYLGKVMSIFVSMDGLIGKDYEAGLARLKEVAEARAADMPAPAETEL